MKDIADLRAKQVRIFASDLVPFSILRTGVGARVFATTHGVADYGFPDDSGELVFRNGAAQLEEGNIAFEAIQFTERRVVVSVVGDSAAATRLYEHLQKLLPSTDDSGKRRWEAAVPMTLTEETTCVATLDIDWPQLFGSPFADFAENELLPAASQSLVPAEIVGVRMAMRIGYRPASELSAHSIAFAAKEFLLETRAATTLGERRYFTASPTSSDVHLQLLATVEQLLGRRNLLHEPAKE